MATLLDFTFLFKLIAIDIHSKMPPEDTDTTETSVSNTDDEEPFLSLPPEIRVMIYAHIIPSNIFLRRENTPTFPPILSINRMIRNEATEAFLNNTRFIFEITLVRPPSFEPLALWLRTLGTERRRMLRHLEIRLESRRMSYLTDMESFWGSLNKVTRIFYEQPELLRWGLKVVHITAMPSLGDSPPRLFSEDVRYAMYRIGEARRQGVKQVSL